ncbi:arylsulfatase [Bryobacterales bacterium F-183]|nr:arylsulfatase [Bryobacterales bacterium F-183]
MPFLTRRELLASFSVSALATAAAPEPRPNIVLILADDLGYGDVSCNNPRSRISTPFVDQIAAQGMRFTDAHTPSAVCTPTRYGLMTGRYAWRGALKDNVLDGFDPPLIERNRTTIAALLQKNGYETACIGKWHLGMQWTDKSGNPYGRPTPPGKGEFRPGNEVDLTKPTTGGPNNVGFDYYYGIAASLDMSPYCFIENNRAVLQGGAAVSTKAAEGEPLFRNEREGVGSSDFTVEGVIPRLTQKAVDFIRKPRPANKPYFLYVPLTSPHMPVVPNRDVEGTSKAGKYGDFVVEMDRTVGRILDAVGDKSNTIVIFTSDNGGLFHSWTPEETDDKAAYKPTPRGQEVAKYGHQGNADLRGTKADIWEGGHRVPFVVRWPGKIKPGSVSPALLGLTDMYATLAQIAGAKVPQGYAEDSISQVDVLTGKAKQARTSIIHHSMRGVFALREGNWKYVPSRGSGGFSSPQQVKAEGGQLYNLATDPRETTNLYATNRKKAHEMDAKLQAERRH